MDYPDQIQQHVTEMQKSLYTKIAEAGLSVDDFDWSTLTFTQDLSGDPNSLLFVASVQRKSGNWGIGKYEEEQS